MTSESHTTETRLHYLRDEALYMLWKYLNGRRLVRKNELDFEDIAPIGMNVGTATILFLQTLKNLEIEPEGLTFNKGIYEFFGDKRTEEEIAKLKPDTKIAIAINKILSTTFTTQDILDAAIMFNRITLADFFTFSNVLSKEMQIKLSSFIDFYLDDFIQNKLEIENQNYFKYDKQKGELRSVLRLMEGRYGNQFILKMPDLFEFHTKEHLFIHTLISMERQGYYSRNIRQKVERV